MTAYVKMFVEAASYFGNNIPVIIVVSASLAGYFVASGLYKEAGVLVLSLLSFFYSVLLKNIFKIPRLDTYVGDPTKLGDIYRFPSSHVIVYVAFWGLLLFLSLKKGVFDGNIMNLAIRIISIYHLVFIGVSRVILGAHTIQDVVAGYFFGLVYLAVLIYLIR